MIELGLIISALVAGMFMFLAPCTLPMIPAYLGFISGVSLKELAHATGVARRRAQRTIFWNGLAFVVGFTIVFVLFGVLAGFLGQALIPLREWMTRIGGVLVIMFGLFMLGAFDVPFLQKERRMQLPRSMQLGQPSTSFLIGLAFAVGWTPCIGPILATILFLASSTSTALQGGMLLLVFSVGLAIPFLLVAGATAYMARWIERGAGYARWVSIIGGVFLIGLGILLVTDNFALTIQYGYQLFDWINYDALLNYL